jgi:hypothetical protein
MNPFEKSFDKIEFSPDLHTEAASEQSKNSESPPKIGRIERKRLKEKMRLMRERFNKNEGNYKIFDASEINAFLKIKQDIQEIKDTVEAKSQDCQYEQKMDILKRSLFELTNKINGEALISQEQINSHVEKKKKKLFKSFAQLQSISKIIDYLDGSNAFAHKIRTSADDKAPYLSQDYLDQKEDISFFLDNLLSQSIYYITPSGMTLRIKLSEIRSVSFDSAIQQPMEQIFFNNQAVNYTDRANNRHKRVVKVSDLTPEQGKFVFEISTPNFQHLLSSKTDVDQGPVKSGVRTIHDEEGVFVNIPLGSILHSGWQVVGVEENKENNNSI